MPAGLGVGGGLCVRRVLADGGQAPSYRPAGCPDAVAAPRVLLLARDPDWPANGLDLAAFAHARHISAAELRVLELLLRGLAPKAIAERLNLGVRTVRS
jgi:DNA-binding NarL/FixJ family response regulator